MTNPARLRSCPAQARAWPAPCPRRLRCEPLESRELLALNASMLLDLNRADVGSYPENYTELGGKVYFSTAAPTPELAELWKTDGTTAGTFLVAGIQTLSNNTRINDIRAVGGKLLIVAADDLLSTDGTSPPTKLTAPGGDDFSNVSFIGNLNGELFFWADTATLGTALWKTNGSASGIALVKDWPTDPTIHFQSGHAPAVILNGALLFTSFGSAVDSLFHLNRTDGTAAGTIELTNAQSGEGLAVAGNRVFFEGDQELWSTDGTVAGTGLVRDISASATSFPRELTPLGNLVLFTADDGVGGRELWKSDGTQAGTVRILDIRPGPAGSDPRSLVALGGVVYFQADDGVHGLELWKSDGTAAGTSLVVDLLPGTGSTSILDKVVLGSSLLLSLDNGSDGTELWKTDGTAAGTVLVKDIFPGGSSTPAWMKRIGNVAYFSAVTKEHGRELWKSDGTTAGTVLVKNVVAGVPESSSPSDFVAAGGLVYFKAEGTDNTGRRLWRTDGTPGGTRQLTDRYNLPVSVTPAPGSAAAFGNLLYFVGGAAGTGAELWKTDGTVAGTQLVVDLTPGPSSSNMGNLTVVGSSLFFTTRTTSDRLYKTDGTAAGTVLLTDFGNFALPSGSTLAAVNGALLFLRRTSGSPPQLWKSDGTPAGTAMVTSLPTGVTINSPLVAVGNFGVFAATDSAAGRELWSTDGTPQGTGMIADINPGTRSSSVLIPQSYAQLNANQLLFMASNGTSAPLWKTDGTSAGTGPLASVSPQNLFSLGSTVYFAGNGSSALLELWKSDGTTAGTVIVKDVRPEPGGSSFPTPVGSAAGQLLFTADDGTHGREVWASDGTAPGTVLVRDIGSGNVGYTGNHPPSPTGTTGGGFGSAAGKMVFMADDGLHGRELWVATDQTPLSYVVPEFAPISSDPRSPPVEIVSLNFSEPVTGVDLTDFSLTRNGQPVPLAGVALTGAGQSYTLDLTVAIAPAGTYVLKLQASGVRDLAGLQLDVNAEATFVVEARPWRNGADPLNVDNVDGIVGLDALLVVNEINNRLFSDPVTGAILIPAPTAQFPFFLDTNGDGFITGIDALLIFNWLNTHPLPSPEGEGELSSSAQEHLVGAPASTGCDAALLAFLEDTPRSLRRRR